MNGIKGRLRRIALEAYGSILFVILIAAIPGIVLSVLASSLGLFVLSLVAFVIAANAYAASFKIAPKQISEIPEFRTPIPK